MLVHDLQIHGVSMGGDGVYTSTLLRRKMKLMSDKLICLMSEELMM